MKPIKPNFSLCNRLEPHLKEFPEVVKIWSDSRPRIMKEIKEAWNTGDPFVAMGWMPNTHRLAFVADNIYPLLSMGKYEEALLDAYTMPRTNCHHYPMDFLRYLFNKADPDKLRAAGDPIPQQDFLMRFLM